MPALPELPQPPPEIDPHDEGCGCSSCKSWFLFMNQANITGRCRNCGRPFDEFHDWDSSKIIRCQRLG